MQDTTFADLAYHKITLLNMGASLKSQILAKSLYLLLQVTSMCLCRARKGADTTPVFTPSTVAIRTQLCRLASFRFLNFVSNKLHDGLASMDPPYRGPRVYFEEN